MGLNPNPAFTCTSEVVGCQLAGWCAGVSPACPCRPCSPFPGGLGEQFAGGLKCLAPVGIVQKDRARCSCSQTCPRLHGGHVPALTAHSAGDSEIFCQEKAPMAGSLVPRQLLFAQLTGDRSSSSAVRGRQGTAGRDACVRFGRAQGACSRSRSTSPHGEFALCMSLLWSQPAAPTCLGKGHFRILSCQIHFFHMSSRRP